MKRTLLVLGLVLLSSLLFAQAGSDPLGDPAGYTNTYQYWLTARLQEQLLVQNQLMARLGAQAEEPAALEAREEPRRLQERSGDCDSDCDGEPDQEQQKLQDGSCEDGGDGPDQVQDRTRSGQG